MSPCTPASAFCSSSSNLLRLGAGRVSSLRSMDLRLTRLWLDYTAMAAIIALGLVLALPLLVAMLGARP